MGIQDRHYYREAPPGRRPSMGMGAMSAWSITTWLIALNIAIFVGNLMLQGAGWQYVRGLEIVETSPGSVVLREVIVPVEEARQLYEEGRLRAVIQEMGPLERWGYFSIDTAITGGQLWRWISFQFLHANLMHILGNMLGLFFFGSLIEQHLGSRRFLAFYLLCGIAGPIVYLFFALAGVLGMMPGTPMVGASAGVFGILLAAAQVAPRTTVMLMIPPIPMQLRTLAWILLGIAIFTVFSRGPNAGGEAAHLGGAALGFVLIRRPDLLNWAEWRPRRRLGGPPSGGSSNMTYHSWR